VLYDRVMSASPVVDEDAVTLDLSIRRDATVDALLSLQSEPIDFSKKTSRDTDEPPDTDTTACRQPSCHSLLSRSVKTVRPRGHVGTLPRAHRVKVPQEATRVCR